MLRIGLEMFHCTEVVIRVNGNKFPAWALAARIVFALSPNSASCERVFALLKRMYSEEQLSSLADAIHLHFPHACIQRAPHWVAREIW